MAKKTSPPERAGPDFTRNLLGALDPEAAAAVVAAGGDMALIIDRSGVIRDIAVSNGDLAREDFSRLRDQRWADAVSVECRGKIEEMLRDAANDAGPRWREINYPTANGRSISLRHIAVNAGEDGRIIALGRDQRMIADLQQRLIEAQQATERDYQRLRDAESRYRLLFQLASEAVIVVDAVTRRIVEANPAAERLIGAPGAALVGQAFVEAFDGDSRDALIALLARAYGGSNLTAQGDVLSGGRVFTIGVSLFRQDRASLFLARLTPRDTDIAAAAPESSRRLAEVLERMPDAFVVADEDLRIVACNSAFLDLSGLASAEQARGQSIDAFLGRPDMDRSILISSLRQHGVLKNFASVARNRLGVQEDVEVSAVHVASGVEPCFGFSVRRARNPAATPRIVGALPRSVEQLSQLVGRVTLKQLVRETTDLVERMCIEAALEMTGNNRASAAEVLGLSRQSLYSKLHRYGLAAVDEDA